MSEKGLCHSDDIDQMISLTVITLTVITLSTVLYSNNSTKYSHTRSKTNCMGPEKCFRNNNNNWIIIIINGFATRGHSKNSMLYKYFVVKV
jgi:hypothetical protein